MNRRRSRFTTIATVAMAVALVVLAAVPLAQAQTTGRIEGRVTAKTGEALPGVTVTIQSPALQGDRLAVTDADGNFRFLALPPGEYSLRAELESYGMIEQSSFQVGLDRTVSLELTLQTFGDEVTVSGAPPVIDKSTTTAGANFSDKLFGDLPVTRTFQGLAFAAPGVTVGATKASGLDDNPSIGGASAAENRYVVDGLDTTDAAFGIIATQVPFEFVKEVQVKTGGYEAEYGGALGGVLNVITKSGGNSLQGDVFGYYSDDSLQSEVPPTATFGQDLGFTQYDLGLDVGGKIVDNKLWYFVAVNPSRNEENYTTRSELPNTETKDIGFYAGKLTWQVNSNHQVVLSAFGDPTDRNNNLIRNSYGKVGTDDTFGAENYQATYNGTLASNLFLEVSGGTSQQTFRADPFTQAPRYEILRAGVLHFAEDQGCAGSLDDVRSNFSTFSFNSGCLGGTFEQGNGDSSRDDLRGAVTWFGKTGSIDHEIKVGAAARRVEYTDFANYPGPFAGPAADDTGFVYDPEGLTGQRWQLFDETAIGVPFALLIEYDQRSVGQTDEQAVYLQDRIRFGDSFSLNLGVRADSFEATGEKSAEFPDRKLDFGYGDMVAPRIGFTWDVTKNGRSKLYGHYGRFYESVPLDINARAFGNEQFNFYYFYYPEDGSLPSANHPGTWFYTYRLGTGVSVERGIEPMYTTEALAGFEYEIAPNVAVGVKWTQRRIENVIEDISADGGQTYFITNPGGTITVNPVTGEPLATPAVFPEPERNYDAWELSVNKRFTDNWQLYGSYVHAVNEGNYGGLFRQDNGQLDPNITSLYDLPDLLVGAFGKLPNDRTHQFKVYGSYLWPFKLVTGFYGQFLSGTPISKLGAHPIYGRAERFITPRGSFGRTEDVWNVDLHLEYPISFGSGLELKLIGDLFNVTDHQAVTQVDQEWTFNRLGRTTDPNECGGPGTGSGTACPAGNPNFGTATEYQTPRTFRLGVKLSF